VDLTFELVLKPLLSDAPKQQLWIEKELVTEFCRIPLSIVWGEDETKSKLREACPQLNAWPIFWLSP